MIKVTDDDIGRAVIYRPRGLPPEEGVIVAFTQAFVFVRYTGEQFSKATRINPVRVKNGVPPIVPLPDAYDACDESELG